MINYNNIPNKTDWGEASNLVNDNFSKTNTKIAQLETLATAGLKYMGTVDALANLPTGAADGNAYLVKTGIAGFPNGEIYVWRSSVWQPTGLSGFPSNVLSATLTNLAVGDVLEYDGTQWINKTKLNAGIALSGGSTKTIQELQEQINQINEDMKSYAERYDIKAIVDVGNEQAGEVFENYFFVVSNDNVLVKTKDYETSVGYPTPSLQGKYISLVAKSENDIFELYANQVTQFEMDFAKCNSIIFNSATGNISSIIIRNCTATKICLHSLLNLKSLTIELCGLTYLSLKGNPFLKSLYLDQMKELTTVNFDEVNALQYFFVNDSSKLTSIIYKGTFDNLKSLSVQRTAMTLDSIIAIGASWTTRIGKDAGKLTVSNAIYNAMTQDQKNVFLNKNINILHE